MAFGDDSYVQDQLSKFPPCAYSLIGKCMLWPTWVLVAMPTFYCSSVYFQVCSAVRLTLSFCLAGRQCACQTGWSLIGDLARYQDPSFLLVSPSAIVHGQKAGRRGGLRHHGGGMVQVRQRAHHLAQTIRAAAVVLPPLGGEHVRSGGDAAGGGGQNSVGAVQRGDRHSFAGEGRAATGHRRLHPARTGGGGSTGARRCAPDRRRGCPGLITQIAAHSKSRRRTRQDSCTYAGMF